MQFLGQPDARRCPTEKVEVFRKGLPDLAVIALHLSPIPSGNSQLLQGNPLRVQHPKDVMVRDDEEFGRRAKTVIGIGEHPWIHVPVGGNDRQMRYQPVKVSGHVTLLRVGVEESVG